MTRKNDDTIESPGSGARLHVNETGSAPKAFKSREVPQIRGMQEFRGTIDEFLSDKFPETNDWLKLVATNREQPQNVFETLKRKFPHLLELILLNYFE